MFCQDDDNWDDDIQGDIGDKKKQGWKGGGKGTNKADSVECRSCKRTCARTMTTDKAILQNMLLIS